MKGAIHLLGAGVISLGRAHAVKQGYHGIESGKLWSTQIACLMMRMNVSPFFESASALRFVR